MARHLVFVGGGHAHMTALLKCSEYVQRGHRVTLVSPDAYHYYSGMGPGMLSGIYRPRDIRFNIRKMAGDRGASFIEDRVVRVDPARRSLMLQSGKTVSYDVASFNTGSSVPAGALSGAVGGSGENVYPVKPIINLLKARQRILEALSSSSSPGALDIVVIGGGPAGVEIAANAWRLVHDNGGAARITIVAGKRLMGGLPEKVCSLVRQSFLKRGISVIEGLRAERVEKDTVLLSGGGELPFDIAFIATGVRPSSLFRDSGLPTGKDGGLLVNDRLQCVDYPELFGGGDCISLQGHDLAKVGVYAVRENEILFHNLLAALEGGTMRRFEPQKTYMLIFNMGNGKGILWRDTTVLDGRLAFILKNYIDNKFMKKFQVSGERKETG
ncbi:MAG: FAD-dependent oxidoreductase [Nitrospirota bacterium]